MLSSLVARLRPAEPMQPLESDPTPALTALHEARQRIQTLERLNRADASVVTEIRCPVALRAELRPKLAALKADPNVLQSSIDEMEKQLASLTGADAAAVRIQRIESDQLERGAEVEDIKHSLPALEADALAERLDALSRKRYALIRQAQAATDAEAAAIVCRLRELGDKGERRHVALMSLDNFWVAHPFDREQRDSRFRAEVAVERQRLQQELNSKP